MKALPILTLILFISMPVIGLPVPGDVFKEFTFIPADPRCYLRTLLGNNSASVPLGHLREGRNEIQFTCGPQICYNFNFGFFWIYSFTIRIYYDRSHPHPPEKIVTPAEGDEMGKYSEIGLKITEGGLSVEKVDFIGFYEDFDWEGNGIFRQWHYQTGNGKLYRHIGSSNGEPYAVTWNTRWIPDQDKPLRLAAIITDTAGIRYMTPGTGDLPFRRKDRNVKMYPSHDIPELFSARIGREKSCSIKVTDDPANAKAACLLLSTWSGKCDDGSVHEVILNGKRLLDNFGVFHDYSFDYISVPVDYIKEGTNQFTVHSKFEGHGLEVNWPSPVLLIEF